jgi:3-O-methylgallate 3,4-dioxygenase
VRFPSSDEVAGLADIVVGVASSHTPQLSSGVDMWTDHAERDQRAPRLLGRDARYHTYDELLVVAPPPVAGQLDRVTWDAKYARCQAAIAALAATLDAARPDIAVIIGDDQRELFLDDGIPAFACFAGPQIIDHKPPAEDFARIPKGIQAAYWAVHQDEPAAHQVQAGLSMHLAEQLALADFDLTVFTQQPHGRTLGHAFTFPRYRLGLDPGTPIVPVFVNTYYPPNVPSAARCYALGQAIASAVASWPASARVAVIASGGLSHFVIDERLDRGVLRAIAAGDAAALGATPRAALRSGNSEILNWITAAGALASLRATVVDYVPGYRSPAGTGTGMAFAQWTPPLLQADTALADTGPPDIAPPDRSQHV